MFNKEWHRWICNTSLDKRIFSQCTLYLIARQKDVIYVAFKSTPEVLKWLEKTSSFNEGYTFCSPLSCQFFIVSFIIGLREQSSQIPLRFFMDELVNNKRLVLTGIYYNYLHYCTI